MGKISLSKMCYIVFAFCIATAAGCSAQTFTTLVNFDGTNGTTPGRPPTQGIDGNLYGTIGGGLNGNGSLFKMTPTGGLTTLYTFCEQTGCPDGSGPVDLLLGADGNLYGATTGGAVFGFGSFFKFTKEDSLTTLFSFDNNDGAGGFNLLQTNDNTFYGTSDFGGNLTECFSIGCGTAFRMTSAGSLTTLYDFCSEPACADGAVAFGALSQYTNGDFYGVTWGGGPGNGGTIFKMTPAGTLTTLYSFCVVNYPFCGDGSNPVFVTLGRDGNFYGTTAFGGTHTAGSAFKITPGGNLTTIYNFCTKAACADGSTPRDGLTLGSDGNFYSTTYFGGANNLGTVFKITPAGVLTTLHNFDGTDGNYPINGLVQATNGAFYGTTPLGGSGGQGTIFSLAVGLGPFVKAIPSSGTVGATVLILGTDLAGSTRVTFNGISAEFKTISTSAIATTVPIGATTGTVTVTTPDGTLKSNAIFIVTP